MTNDTYDMTGLVEKVVEQWGNALGDVPETKISAKTVNYYNADNEVSSVVSYGANLSTGIYEPSYYEGVIFNEKGLPAKRFHQQYGLYDDYDLAYTEANDTTYYKYDENDRLVEEKSTQSLDSIVYEYDADGNMVSKMRYVPDSYGTHGGVPYVMEGYTYSDFVAPNCPQTIVGTGAYASYINSYKVYYDEDNNIVKKEKYDEGGTLRQVEHWTYELGILAKYEINTVKSATGDDGEVTYTENPSKKTIYTVVGTNPLRIKDEQMTYTYGEWAGYTYHHVTEYCKPDATTAPKLVVEPVADELNTVMLTFDATDVAGASSVAYDVYRHGIKVARVPASEAVDGMVTYVDNNVYNGSYDYFVQAVDEAADQSGEAPSTLTATGESVSNTVARAVRPRPARTVKRSGDKRGILARLLLRDPRVGRVGRQRPLHIGAIQRVRGRREVPGELCCHHGWGGCQPDNRKQVPHVPWHWQRGKQAVGRHLRAGRI